MCFFFVFVWYFLFRFGDEVSQGMALLVESLHLQLLRPFASAAWDMIKAELGVGSPQQRGGRKEWIGGDLQKAADFEWR